jgi:hypothetical protein
MSGEQTAPPTPDWWDGDKRISGTEDFENDFDPTAYPYKEPDRPVYDENYKLLENGRAFSSYSVVCAPGVPTKLLGEDPSRDFFYINSIAANSVIIGEQSAVAVGLGYIVAGAEKLSTTREVWATPVGTQPVAVSFWVERKA